MSISDSGKKTKTDLLILKIKGSQRVVELDKNEVIDLLRNMEGLQKKLVKAIAG